VIVYFADRKMNILGQASTTLPKGLMVTDDTKNEDVESGVAVFECEFGFDANTRAKIEACVEVGNYILRKHDEENEFYTIIDSEVDTKKQTAYIYAEDAGLDLLNEIVGAYEADQAYPIDHYIEKFAYVGKKTNGEPIIIIFDQCICTSGFETEGKNKEASVFSGTFECVADLSPEADTLPWHILYPTPTA
jgi:hypothetical protein